MKKWELVFIPSPGIGHLVSTVEMAKNLVNQNHEHLSITLLLIKLPFLDTKATNIYVESLSQSPVPGMKLVELDQEHEESFMEGFKISSMFHWIDSHKGKVRDFLSEISSGSSSSKLCGIVVDMFCTSMIDVANEFGVPNYVFYTSCAAMLGLLLHFQSLRDDFKEDVTEYKEKDVNLAIPTYINPVPAKVLPGILFDKDGGGCDALLDQVRRYRETKGIIVNTFLELETHAIEALSKDSTIPPIYTAGPILNLETSKENQKSEQHILLKWLDLHPQSSVVFLCFGSFGSFSVEQVKEIANALERSGHRFLWSLRKPPAEGKVEPPGEYDNLEEVLPEGFLERTSEIGKVIGWAPQVAVLSHPAVGGFVSHCGWNSIMESIWFGVPIATWPLYSEQQVNAFELVKDLEMAVEIKMDYMKDFRSEASEILGADLIEERIRCLMDPQNEMIRNKVKEMKEKSRLAFKQEEGPSYSSMKCFIHGVLGSNPCFLHKLKDQTRTS